MSPAAEGGLVGGGVLVNAQWIGLEAANWKNISSVLVVFFFFWLFAGAVPALSCGMRDLHCCMRDLVP